MLYIGIPVLNEAPTIGVLLWQLRRTFQDYSREYEVLVYDDASTDSTAEVLGPYTEVLPLTVIRGPKHVGYGGALDAIVRTVCSQTRYAKRDALITMQGDLTDQPSHIPELVKRFEGGADIVVAESPTLHTVPSTPVPVRRLRRVAPWIVKAGVPGVEDPFGSFRLYRIAVLRELLKQSSETSLIKSPGWSANVELLRRMAPLARRIETVTVTPRYDLRLRPSRVRPWSDALTLYKHRRSA